jgi:lysozyme family protein
MPSIDSIIDNIIEVEGGLVNDPLDMGGITKYGITKRTLSAHWGYEVVDSDIINLDLDTAKKIYESRYYYGPGINTLPEQVQPQVLDICVNSGPFNAIRLLQDVLRLSGEFLEVDGVLGSQTKKACASALLKLGEKALNGKLVDRRIEFYNAIVLVHPEQGKFLKGWLNRAERFR